MAGGHMKYRTLGRNSAHRKALLRNLVTSLVKQESIQTTYAKAKEAQTVADKLITLAKRNNETARRAAQGILFTPDKLLPKVFGELRERYADRPGGYTRVLRIEPLNRTKLDQAESAILEFVDGKVDTRFAMTAAAVARSQVRGRTLHPTTQLNVKKVTAFRKNGKAEFRALVEAIKKGMPRGQVRDIDNAEYTLDEFEKRKKVYEAKLQAYHEYKEQRDLEYKQKREGRGARQRRLRREKKGIVQSEEEGEEPFLNAGEGKGEGQKQPRRSAPRAEELEHDIAASEWEDVDEAAVSHEEARARPKKRAVTGRGANKLQWKYPPKKPKLPLKYRAEKPTRAAPVKASF